MSKEKQNQEIASIVFAMFITNFSDPEFPISQSITGIIVKAINEYVTKQIPLVISDTLKTFSELNDLRREGTINRSNVDTSVRQLHERISKMEMSGHPNLLSTLLSLNEFYYNISTFVGSHLFAFRKNYRENSQ